MTLARTISPLVLLVACSTVAATSPLPELSVPAEAKVDSRFLLRYMAPAQSTSAIYEPITDSQIVYGRETRLASIAIKSSAWDRVLYSSLYSVGIRVEKNDTWMRDEDFPTQFRATIIGEEKQALSSGWRLISELGTSSAVRLNGRTWLCGYRISALSSREVAGYFCASRMTAYAAAVVAVTFGKPVSPESPVIQSAISDVNRLSSVVEVKLLR